MRKTHDAILKFKVALAALTGQPITDICKQYEVAESLVHKWKKQLKDNGTVIFSQKAKKQEESHEAEVAKLYQRIGQLITELDFLKKVVEA
jgi:transposase-like protein